MKEYKELNFNEWLKHWHDLHVALFGEEIANEMAKKDMRHNSILKKLWQEKGFKTIGEYAEWEKDHLEERNDFFRKNGEEIW